MYIGIHYFFDGAVIDGRKRNIYSVVGEWGEKDEANK